MGLIVLTLIGAIFGWLLSIVAEQQQNREILLNMAVGAAGAVVGGFLVQGALVFFNLSGLALLISMLAAVGALALFQAMRDRLPI
ncbi:hypothetical protein HME9302_02535 [Alteripontixanthobacter maritimus]|uniref:GlsB/YeaQ/YmgE family stress response membrane protein n=1 Tax=Alteripontixanthobacter maritimus TaxID=2161824 RepID=A0A369Q9D0_9SPHN|nr:hypothetical protein [Alteripontixanthobacter maritimus]RDC61314.1 hypothetical protein HME9302_02535 [Alteripontixanthobacter maritimus]